jgi:hypothetical protein
VNALNRERTAWDKDDPKFSKDVAEAIRRGLTVDACRQLMSNGNAPANLPANVPANVPATDSGTGGGFFFLFAIAIAIVFFVGWFVTGISKESASRKNKYSDTARIVDVVAFLVLASGLFVPIVRIGFRMMHLVETDFALIFAGAALAGLAAALASFRRIAVTSALVYGALFAFFVVNFQQRLATMSAELKDNPFRGLAEASVGLEWGCAVITFAVPAVLCSNIFVRRTYQP